MPAKLKPVRRIVTGETDQGQSSIVADGLVQNVFQPPGTSSAAYVLWATGEAAVPGDDPAPANHSFGFVSPGGTILRIVDFAPDSDYDSRATQEFLEHSDVRSKERSRHFLFHKTQSLDYAIVLEGEIYAMMDLDEVLMKPGDVLIQRATNHSWSNRSEAFCRVAFVLIDQAAASKPEQPDRA